jgi:mannose-6-phosphate isomerase
MTAESATDWLTRSAWPLWLAHGVDWEAGAFREHLAPDGLTCSARFRRLRVAARQTYVFAHAARAGVPLAADATALGLDFLRRHARQPDGGYAWRFGLDNAPIDQTRDLYDHAFVLLAYATAAPDARGAADARAVLAYIEAHFPHDQGGFHEAVPPALPRRQNPHMHLLEALLAAHAAFGDPVYLDHADGLVDLFLDRLLNHEAGVLPEFFDAALLPERDPEARFLFEPGHHYEWAWLLDWYLRAAVDREVRDIDIEGAIRLLLRHAERWGIDPATGLVRDVLMDDGSVVEGGSRLWPQTERVKAAIRRPRLVRADARACLGLMRRYFREDVPGLWYEHWRADGPVSGEPSPASSLYHLTCAIMEGEG